jgi:hypothetical protein
MTETLPWASVMDLWYAIRRGDHDAVAYAQEAPRSYPGQPLDRAGCARYSSETRPPQSPPHGERPYVTKIRAERNQLATRVHELESLVRERESQLEDAWEAAHAAWDAVADQPYRPARSRASQAASRRTRLLLTPQSGARPLVRAAG